MTQATVRKMGNSLGVVIPKADVRAMRLKEGDRVTFEVKKVASMADTAGLLKGKLGDIDALMREMDEEDRRIEARKDAMYAELLGDPRPKKRRGK